MVRRDLYGYFFVNIAKAHAPLAAHAGFFKNRGLLGSVVSIHG